MKLFLKQFGAHFIRFLIVVGFGFATKFCIPQQSISNVEITTASIVFLYILYPFTIFLGYNFFHELISDPFFPRSTKLLFLLVVILIISFVIALSSNSLTFSCFIFECTADALPTPTQSQGDDYYNNTSSQNNSMGMIVFFTAVASLPVGLYQFLRLLWANLQSSPSSTGSGNVFLESETDSPMMRGSEMISRNKPQQEETPSPHPSPDQQMFSTTTPLNSKHLESYLSLQQLKTRWRSFGFIIGFLFLFPIHVLLTMRLPNGFQWFRPYFLASSVAMIVGGSPGDDYLVDSLWEGAWNITEANNIGFIPQWLITQDINLKLYPDVMIFYSFLYFIVVVAILSHSFPIIHSFLGKRSSFLLKIQKSFHSTFPKPIPLLPSGLTIFNEVFIFDLRHPFHSSLSSITSLTFGEIFLFLSFCIFLIGMFLYWFLNHGYINAPIDSYTPSERWGRTLGQVAISAMGFLLFPISRNGIFTTLFRVNWEGMIKFHRYIGNIFLSLSIAHLICFLIRFKELSILPSALLSWPNPFQPFNYTISPMTVIFLILGIPIFGILTMNIIRRKWFELFYFSHFFSMVFMMAILHHAASAWYFVLPGIALWAIDHALRMTRSCEEIEIVSLRPASEGVTELCFRPKPKPHSKPSSASSSSSSSTSSTSSCSCSSFFKNVLSFFSRLFTGRFSFFLDGNLLNTDIPDQYIMPFEPGQIVFLSIPSIGPYENHPFTISSSPLDAVFTCHIRAMGKNTFTERLYQFAIQNQQKNQQQQEQQQQDPKHEIEYGPTEPSTSTSSSFLCPLISPIAFSMDGPYGIPFSPFDSTTSIKTTTTMTAAPSASSSSTGSRVLLIGGGIGITPLHSIFRTSLLLQQSNQNNNDSSIKFKEIKLLWSVRELSLVEIDSFHDTFARVLRLTQKKRGEKNLSSKNNNNNKIQLSFGIFCSGLKQKKQIYSSSQQSSPFFPKSKLSPSLPHYSANPENPLEDDIEDDMWGEEGEDDSGSNLSMSQSFSLSSHGLFVTDFHSITTNNYNNNNNNQENRMTFSQSFQSFRPSLSFHHSTLGSMITSQYLLPSSTLSSNKSTTTVPVPFTSSSSSSFSSSPLSPSKFSVPYVVVTPGRMDIKSSIEAMRDDPNALVIVCGPEQMVESAISFCTEYNVPIHVETFLL